MKLSKTLSALAAGAAMTLASAAPASADQVKYLGAHPSDSKGFCYIEAAHVHVYAPSKKKNHRKLLYRVHDGSYQFVGDPVAHGYDGDRVAYYGHHPIALDATTELAVLSGAYLEGAPHQIETCYLDGPHFHAFAPPSELAFEVKGDAHWFVGAHPKSYKRHRRKLARINAYYTPVQYRRPVITVEPPAAYVGVVVKLRGPELELHQPRAHLGSDTELRGPVVHAGVEVEVVAPRLEIGLGLPTLFVGGDGHHHHEVKHRKHKRHKRSHKRHKRSHKRSHKRHKRSHKRRHRH